MHKSTAILIALILPAIAVGQTAAEPLAMGSMEVNVTVAEWAMVSIEGPIQLSSVNGDASYSGTALVDVAANFPYSVTAQWLDGAGWTDGASSVSHNLNTPALAGSMQSGQLTVEVHTSGESGGTGSAEGAHTSSTATVLFPDEEPAGTVQVTLFKDNSGS